MNAHDQYLIRRKETFENAKNAFLFLKESGYEIVFEDLGKSISFKDGWKFIYSSVNSKVEIKYYDVVLEIIFSKDKISIDYFTLDYYFFNNSSGFSGQMFSSFNELNSAISRIAEDIKLNYFAVYSNEKTVWDKIRKLFEDLKIQNDAENTRIALELANPHAREKADKEFKNKNYEKVIELLTPLETNLSNSYLLKLEYAKKHKK